MNPPSKLDEVLRHLNDDGIALPPGKIHITGYGDEAELSNALLALIRSGKKHAGTSLVWQHEYDNEAWAEVGDIEIVLDHAGNPSIITRIAHCEILPFKRVSAEYAAMEGEGDGSLNYWRQAHWDYFSRVCIEIGKPPSEDMLVVCSVFEVVYIFPQGE